ncbi:MAG: zeta toxin family protein [Methylacidiphilales bacterium]|nr:zeta toxin family protein [Candidatus Methylacidiphilales bacterium]
MAKPRCIIIAGPNGAGKTTLAREYLPQEGHCPVFVNADLIAAGLSPFRPDTVAWQAGRLFLRQIDALSRQRKDFAFETTLSGLAYVRRIEQWKISGYSIHILFLKLSSPALAIQRVRQRVRLGGHSLPEEMIRRRFHSGWINFDRTYRRLADSWAVYDNSGVAPILLEQGP